MKIAALYDVHGNLPALNAILAELEEIQPDLIIVGGDIVSGPMPAQTLDRLAQAGEHVCSLRGNADREIVMLFDGQDVPAMSDQTRVQSTWVAQQLTRAQRDWLQNLPELIPAEIAGLGTLIFCHATVRSDEEFFTQFSPEDHLHEIFSDVQQDIVVCGHTHIQFERHTGKTHIINAGSVGMPYADKTGAYWLLLGPQGYEFRYTSYDIEGAAREMEASGYPFAHEFVEEYVRTIHTATEAGEFFEALAVKGRAQKD